MIRYTGKSAMEIGDPPGWRNRGERQEPVEYCKHGIRVSQPCRACFIELLKRTGRWYGKGLPDVEDL